MTTCIPKQNCAHRVHHPNSRGHTEAWESISPTQGATPKLGSPYPQLKGPRQSLGVSILNSRGHAKAWESVSPTQGATAKRGSPYPELKGPHRSVGVHHPNSRDLQRGGENCEPAILNGTGRLMNWPSFLNSTGRLKAHNWADWLHHPCLLGVPMVGSNRPKKRVDVVGMRKKVEMGETGCKPKPGGGGGGCQNRTCFITRAVMGSPHTPNSPTGVQGITHDTFLTTSKICGICAKKKILRAEIIMSEIFF